MFVFLASWSLSLITFRNAPPLLKWKPVIARCNASICHGGIITNRFRRLVGRQPRVSELHPIYKTFSLVACVERSEKLAEQPICLCSRLTLYPGPLMTHLHSCCFGLFWIGLFISNTELRFIDIDVKDSSHIFRQKIIKIKVSVIMSIIIPHYRPSPVPLPYQQYHQPHQHHLHTNYYNSHYHYHLHLSCLYRLSSSPPLWPAGLFGRECLDKCSARLLITYVNLFKSNPSSLMMKEENAEQNKKKTTQNRVQNHAALLTLTESV